MTAPIASLFVLLLLVASAATLALYFSNRRLTKKLDSCSDLIHDIFKVLDEPSSVNRILSQETPAEELSRLKHLLERRGQSIMLENQALRQTLRELPDGVVALDSLRSVIFCNREFCNLFQIPNDSHEGKKVFEILRHHAALTAAENFLSQTLEDIAEGEFLVAADKTLRLRMIRLKPGSVVDSLFVFSDISQLKKLEAMRRDFVANVSHELRTPLTSIHGFIETLLEGAGADTATRERFLGLMKTDSERLRRLIEDLLALSRIESQTAGFEKLPLNVSVEVDEALELFALRIHQKRLALEKKIEPDLVVSANPDQFRQVLVNLLDNAVKFTPEGGLISVVAVNLNGKVEIRIADSGSGVHPDNREKIFQRFFREDKARSRETGGTGLGLAIVKHIVESHLGQVRCEGGPNQRGSVFILTFPAK